MWTECPAQRHSGRWQPTAWTGPIGFLNRVSQVRFLPGPPNFVVFRMMLDVPASPSGASTERWLFGTEHRGWACSRAKGDTLEVAIGTGLNLPSYPPDVRLPTI